MAIYANSNQGDLIVLESDLNELNRLTTGMAGADNVIWCGEDVTVLEFPDKVIMVGKWNETQILDLGSSKKEEESKIQGLKCYTELDGLRIVTSDHVFFFERVQDHVIETFKTFANTPAAKLLNAVKSVAQGVPNANEIIKELSTEQILEGVETLLDIAVLEHWDVDILKHILSTASFAKKYIDAQDFDPDRSKRYVDVVKHMTVLTKLRHSNICPRAITYQQFEKYTPGKMLKLLFKFRDYK